MAEQVYEGEVVVPAKARTARESALFLAEHVARLANTIGMEDRESRPTAKEAAIELDGVRLALEVLADRLEGPSYRQAIVDALDALRPGTGKGPPVERIEYAIRYLNKALAEEG